MDLDLLHSFVSVVDTGGFTRAGERVHRTQSTVSQQIRKLEAGLGCELFLREGRQVRLTEDGERLLGYARRMLALSTEIREVVSGAARVEVLRLGVPDDFSVQRLTAMVADFARAHPGLRISMRCDLSMALHRAMERGELDVALLKREPGLPGAQAVWPERLVWLCGPSMPAELPDPVPLVLFPQGCLYRNRAIHALESTGRRWRIAYESANVNGLLAALEGGLGLADGKTLHDARAARGPLAAAGPQFQRAGALPAVLGRRGRAPAGRGRAGLLRRPWRLAAGIAAGGLSRAGQGEKKRLAGVFDRAAGAYAAATRGMGNVFAAGCSASTMAAGGLTGTAMERTSHTLEARPPGRYSLAVAAQQPQQEATPSSNCRSPSELAPASTQARTWRSVTALQMQTYMRIIIGNN